MKKLSDFIKIAKNSKVEVGASWSGDACNDITNVIVRDIKLGKVDQVIVPKTGNTIHSHPRGCKDIDNCSIQWPSASDMALYAERYDETHLCYTKEGKTYLIKSNYMFDEDSVECIKQFYDKLEAYFDGDNIDSHADYTKIFMVTAKLHKWFTIKLLHVD